LAAAALLGAAGLALPALGQSASFDMSKHLDLQATSSPTVVEMDWLHKARAVTWVGRLCYDPSGSPFASTTPFVAAGVLHSRIAIADTGQNNLCTASAQATAQWSSPTATRFLMDVRALGAANPVSDKCVGKKLRPARAHARSKSILTLTLDGLGAGASGVKGFSAAWVNNQNTLQGFKQRAKLLRDPVMASLYDASGTTLLGSWEIVNVESRVLGNGQTSMFNDDGGLAIANNARDMELSIRVGGTGPSIVDSNDRGLIHVVVKNGVVTERTVDGRFATVTGIPAVQAGGTVWNANINLSGIHYDMQVPAGTPTKIKFDMGGSGLGSSEDGAVGPICSSVSRLDAGAGGADLCVAPTGNGALGHSCRFGDQAVLEDVTTTVDTRLDHMTVPYFIVGAAPGTSPTTVYLDLFDGAPGAGGTLIYSSVTNSQNFAVEDMEAYCVFPNDLFNTSCALSQVVLDLAAVPVIPANTHLWARVAMAYPGSAFIGVPSSPFSDNSVDNAMGYSYSTGQYSLLTDPVSGQRACKSFGIFGGAPQVCADIGVQGGVPGEDGILDNNDFVVFIGFFFDGDPAADIGMAGGVPGSDGLFDNNDFVVFVDQFFSGC
jgi:hypothetical protein